MNCRDCPYIREQFNRRMISYEYLMNNCNYTEEECKKEAEESCWCDKTGGKVWWYGQCSDAHSPTVMFNKKNKKCKNVKFIKHKNGKMGKKREREIKHRNHAKKIEKIYQYGWCPPYYYKKEKWLIEDGHIEIIELQKPYYQRNYRGHRSKWIKKQCNRSVRRYKGKIPNGGSYKKIDDFWWEMY